MAIGLPNYDPFVFKLTSAMSASTNPMANNTKTKIKIGDTVRVIGNTCNHGVPRGALIKVTELYHSGAILVKKFGCFIDFCDLEIVSTAKPKEAKFDLSALDAVIVEKAVRDEIEAVLKQHKHAKVLFEEWGLGDTIQYGRGMSFLFYGGPGTGKTAMSEAIARATGMELLTIGAAEIQSQEPGGANRNIQNAFKSAKESKKILFLDECDSLITARTEVGMILGSEINTLLTEIERSEGIVILATNMIENLDPALERRIALIVEFPEPNFEQREQIWKRLIPKKLPIEDDVTTSKLAEYKLTGGQIKNVILQAARLAMSAESKKVTLGHFESAIERVNKSKSLMGTASRYKQIRVRDDFKKS